MLIRSLIVLALLATSARADGVVFDGTLGFGVGESSTMSSDSSGSMGLGADVGHRVTEHLAFGGQAGVDVYTPSGYLWIRVTQLGAAVQLRGGPLAVTIGGGLALASSLRLQGTDEISTDDVGIGGSATAILPLFSISSNAKLGLSARLSAATAGDTTTFSAVIGAGLVI